MTSKDGGSLAKDRIDFKIWLKEEHPGIEAGMTSLLLRYGELVAESSDRLGLVAAGDHDRLFTRHLQESLVPQLLAVIPPQAVVLDVGSGGGFPGIPIAIVRPDLGMTLAEPRQKKAAFLERVVLSLGLGHVTVFPGTVEDLALRHAEPAWDCVVARGLRWTVRMIRALDTLLRDEAVVVRFGAVRGIPAGVRVIPLGGSERAVQVWPRVRWQDLAGAP
jgi:16S rRNA (guanine(527)-N(7))-methyltransferase RsmG